MTDTYTKAQFWKCALQVNSHTYPALRGEENTMTEIEYNQQLLKICKAENIKVLGIADHGNVSNVEAIRNIMKPENILVFPGFEIASSEKIHFVCLFDGNKTVEELNQYLGKLDAKSTNPSTLSAEEIFKRIEDLDGFFYAAHCTNDSGLLKQKMDHIWKNKLLKVAQIPGAIDDLKSTNDDFYHKVIRNKEPNYRRETSIAIINAKDVDKPETLKHPSASCLIKMTNPSFEAFKLAFQDPDSRIRLNSDLAKQYYSRIESVKIKGGYLNEVEINFSEHLNAVIGGRGTGKSTLLECIRYALGLIPITKNAQKQHNEIIKENIGKSKGWIELIVRSSKMDSKRYTISKRFDESINVRDENGNISSFTPGDILPNIEIYGQNEIHEIAHDNQAYEKLLHRFLGNEHDQYKEKIIETLNALEKNRSSLNKVIENKATTEEKLNQLSKLCEREEQFNKLEIEDKLKIIPFLEKEKRLKNRAKEELENFKKVLGQVIEALPNKVFLSDKVIEKLPHTDILGKIRESLDHLNKDAKVLLNRLNTKFAKHSDLTTKLIDSLQEDIRSNEEELEKTFKELPSSQGKSGSEIGNEYQQLLQSIEKIKPQQDNLTRQKNWEKELQEQRKSLLTELSEYRASQTAFFESSLKKLNHKLKNKLRLTIKPKASRQPVIDFLLKCNLENVAENRLQWISKEDDFSPVKLAELIEKGKDALTDSDWKITPTVTEALTRLSPSKILQLQELELPDLIEIELNTAHEGSIKYRTLDKLSRGQQCTAILHLLLLQNKDPLIMDQPEDNLDNAFIADRIVTELRDAKLGRQFIFATHNANIPVFGDAEWIGVFNAVDGQGIIPTETQGAIDVPTVREKAASILEGGQTAFNQRKLKYGY